MSLGIGVGVSPSLFQQANTTPAALGLDFVSMGLTNILDSKLTFTRASAATRYNSSGLIETVGTNIPRFDYNPTTLSSRGLLLECFATNIAYPSEDFSNAGIWNNVNGLTITPNATISPSGVLNAQRLTRTSTAQNYIQSFSTGKSAVAQPWVASVYVKQDTAAFVALRLQGQYPSRADVCFNFATETFSLGPTLAGAFTNVVSGIQKLPNGWYRLIVGGITDAATQLSLTIGPRPNSGEVDFGTPSSGESCFVWGTQVEQGSYATSYIPTPGLATVTRVSDFLTCSGTNFSSWYNQPNGTFGLVFTRQGVGGTTDAPVIFRAAGGASEILSSSFVNNTNTVLHEIKDSVGTTVGTLSPGTSGVPNAEQKLITTYTSGTLKLAGTSLATTNGALASLPTFTNFRLGGAPGVDTKALTQGGWYSKLQYWNSVFTDTQMNSFVT